MSSSLGVAGSDLSSKKLIEKIQGCFCRGLKRAGIFLEHMLLGDFAELI
jgi:hypothetical protein